MLESNTLESWIFGAIVLGLLVALHWLAYRVGKARRRTKRKGMSNDPLTPE